MEFQGTIEHRSTGAQEHRVINNDDFFKDVVFIPPFRSLSAFLILSQAN